jgi:hypothetical protein
VDEPPPLSWWWQATCDPCKDYDHLRCEGRDPASTFLCICDLDRCLPEGDPRGLAP